MVLKRFKKHLFVLFLITLVIPNVKAETAQQKMNIVLRSIAHEFLLQIGDKSSRILPVEIIDNRYVVRFEKHFAYEPDMLLFASTKVLEEQQLSESFIVEVEKCETNEIIHAFETNLKDEDKMQPCKGRALPEGCYVFYFTLLESSVAVPIEVQEKTASNLIYWILFLLGFIILVAYFYLYTKKKRSKSDSNLIEIGQYQYDQKGMLLLLKAQTIELSSKESDLLYLLFTNENKTLEREYILKVVWGDEGDYVGRTLDVFISKLRKKLEADPSLKIVNVRGVGYRFVMN
ncbi:winged helix-turn-helix domain-containing protein [Crocinitomix catalasitica]|uniref:winged helix-turn-helix domain-containing protein n=1 Tax=Crocinitomix catalasitica TaxID=184607 RepID=UPI000688EA8E|nr:response regulator transcription factor [Crocinitomix catalasitica]